MRLIFLLVLLALSNPAAVLHAQDAFQHDGRFRNPALMAIAQASSTWGWIDFREEAMLQPRSLFRDHPDAFQLGPDDAMELIRVDTDRLGWTHFRFQQKHRGIPVFGGEFLVHQNAEGRVVSGNGKIISGLNVPSIPGISESEALETALAFADGDHYAWLDQAAETALKASSGDPNATYFPKGKLVLQRPAFDKNYRSAQYRLTWAFDVVVGFHGESRTIYVDALSGEFQTHLPISRQCAIGSGTTAHYGEHNIGTHARDFGYDLLDSCTVSHPYTLHTRDMQRTNAVSSLIEYLDMDNVWNSPVNTTGVSVHFAAQRTRDYYDYVHNRASWDDANGDWDIYNEVGFTTSSGTTSHNNACWDCYNNVAAFGGGNSSTSALDDWNTLDITGHEFTHGVVETSADLVYANESGALNESYADIFGEMVEAYTLGTPDWEVGAEFGAIRSFSDPSAFGDPDTYQGINWYAGSLDNGGVHTNSSVQNRWFHLLATGGSGTNDYGDAYTVDAIGLAAARSIAYRALTVYLTSTDQYIDAREASIRAARDLFGHCSVEAISCGRAWYAVGVGQGSSLEQLQVCGPYTADLEALTFVGIEEVTTGGTCTNTTLTALLAPIALESAISISMKPGTSLVPTTSAGVSARVEACSYTTYKWSDDYGSDPAAPTATVASKPDMLDQLTVWPNPAVRRLNIQWPFAEGEHQLRIFRANGRVLFEEKMHDQTELQLDVGTWPPGMYAIELVRKGHSSTARFVVHHH